ncbi:MAG: DNA polymerase III subunit beta [Campylobacterota bacterium]|nr:DNA polymerase III subunit beta [Campylobacterota bacterium]
MNISIQKSVLENILIHSQPFLEKKDASQITSHIYFKTMPSMLIVKSTDNEIGLEITTNQLNIIQDGRFTVNGKKLLDIIKGLKDSEIILEYSNEVLHVKQSKSKFKLPSFKSEDFPTFPKLENRSKIELPSNILIQSLKKITPSTDVNNPKFELNGALVDIKNSSINFVSTDTKRLSIVEINNSSKNEVSLIIPKKAIIEIQKLFFDNIEIYYDETHLIIKSEQFFFFSKLINGKFPDYKRIVPKEIKTLITLPKSDIIEAIKQINSISAEIKITFKTNSIIFESLSTDNSEAKIELLFNTNVQEEFEIAVNIRYILDFLSQCSNINFSIGINESNLPFVLIDENFKTIVMPIVM